MTLSLAELRLVTMPAEDDLEPVSGCRAAVGAAELMIGQAVGPAALSHAAFDEVRGSEFHISASRHFGSPEDVRH